MTPTPTPARQSSVVVYWAGKRDSWVVPQRAEGVQDREGLHLEPHPLEEDDIFLAGFFLVAWCGVRWHGWEGCPPGLEGEALGEHISWGWARGLVGGVCGGHGAVAAELARTQRAAIPRGVLILAHELAEKELLLQVERG